MKSKQILGAVLSLVLLIISLSVISSACSGCLSGETCYNIGEKAEIDGQMRYCDLATKSFLAQKALGSSCINDFECAGDFPCLSGECYDVYGSIVDFDLVLTDEDSDGIIDQADNCLGVSNFNQDDSDSDGMGDACDSTPFGDNPDTDGDGINNTIDNCVNVSNINQTDSDSDGIGNDCDSMPSDTDNDGINNTIDNCLSAFNPNQADADHDGMGDACDSTPNGVVVNTGTGGGPSSTSSSTPSGNSYTISNENFQKGYSAYLKIGDIIFFEVKGVYHQLKIRDILKDRIVINLDDSTKNIELYPEKAQNFDVTSDALYDVEVIVKSIYYSQRRVTLSLRAVQEIKPETRVASEPETINEPAEAKDNKLIIYTVIIIALFAIGTAGVYFYLRRKNMNAVKKQDK